MPDHLANPSFNPFSDEILHLKGIFDNTEVTSPPRSLERQSSFDSLTASPSPSCGHHPLRSAGISNGFADSGVTRPHLSRVLTTRLIDFEEDQRGGEDSDDVDLEPTEEKAVLVHKIAQHDSLAGVALKYGINTSELRRANHLWASDSIHLRKELYIPLDKVSRFSVAPDPSQVVSPQASGSSISTQVYSGDFSLHDSMTADHSMPNIRKIPTNQLSFFPPSARSLKAAHDGPLVSASNESQHNSRLANTPPTSLNAILNALPIAASTRDSIMARLSFESTSSSYNDRDHELDDVRIGRHARSISHDGVTDNYNNTPKAQKTTPPRPRVLKKIRGRPESSDINLMNFSRQDVPAYPMTSPNITSSSPDITFPVPIRTVQMEPSPTMFLPSPVSVSVRSKTLGSSVGTRKERRRHKLIDVEFDSNGSNGNGSPHLINQHSANNGTFE